MLKQQGGIDIQVDCYGIVFHTFTRYVFVGRIPAASGTGPRSRPGARPLTDGFQE
ncbi:hypothetical protein GCM10027089_14200 [Nocardia thraciensis]